MLNIICAVACVASAIISIVVNNRISKKIDLFSSNSSKKEVVK